MEILTPAWTAATNIEINANIAAVTKAGVYSRKLATAVEELSQLSEMYKLKTNNKCSSRNMHLSNARYAINNPKVHPQAFATIRIAKQINSLYNIQYASNVGKW